MSAAFSLKDRACIVGVGQTEFSRPKGAGKSSLVLQLEAASAALADAGLIVMEGALPIRATGSLVGAVGVSGAPGGEKDAACAAAALKKVEERLEFAE